MLTLKRTHQKKPFQSTFILASKSWPAVSSKIHSGPFISHNLDIDELRPELSLKNRIYCNAHLCIRDNCVMEFQTLRVKRKKIKGMHQKPKPKVQRLIVA